jgi:chromosome segregation ATPase
MIKKGVLGAALAAGALYLAFGTSAPSYVRTAFHKVRGHAHDAVPVQFEIDRARQEIARLEKPIKETREVYFRTEVETEQLEREVTATKANLEKEKTTLLALRDSVKSGDLKLTGNVRYSTEELNSELARRFDHYRNNSKFLVEKEATLKAKKKIMDAARQQLNNMRNQQREMTSKLNTIEARLQQIEATKQTNEFNFDDSALARAKENVSDLEKRVEVQARIAEVEGRFADPAIPLFVEPGRDVVKEIDEEFGNSSKDSGSKTDKSL